MLNLGGKGKIIKHLFIGNLFYPGWGRLVQFSGQPQAHKDLNFRILTKPLRLHSEAFTSKNQDSTDDIYFYFYCDSLFIAADRGWKLERILWSCQSN